MSSLQVPESQQKYMILWEFTSSLQSWTTDVNLQYSLSFPSYIQSTRDLTQMCPLVSHIFGLHLSLPDLHHCPFCFLRQLPWFPGPRLSSLLLILFNMPESVLTRLTTSLHPASFQKWTNDSKLLFSICLSLVEVFFQSSNKY